MLSKTPPMGFNTWNTFGENINEQLIKETADKMVELGLRDCGYEYLVIDDCWSKRERDPQTGKIVPDEEKFPNDEGSQRLCPQQGAQIRHVFLRRNTHLRRLSGQL